MARRRSPASACATGRVGRLATRARCLRRQPITCRRLWLHPYLPRHDFPQRAQAPPGGSVRRRSVPVKLEVPHRHRPAGPRPCECRPSRGSPCRIGSRRGSRWVTPRASSPTPRSARPTSAARSEKRRSDHAPAKPRAPPAGGLDARRRAPGGRSRCVFPDPTGRGPQRIGSRQHRRPERVRRAAAPLTERTPAMEGSTRQPSDLESTAGRRAWDPDGFDGPPHSCPVSRWRWRAVAQARGNLPPVVDGAGRKGQRGAPAPGGCGAVGCPGCPRDRGGRRRGGARRRRAGTRGGGLERRARRVAGRPCGVVLGRVAVEMARGEGGPALVLAEAPLQERDDAPRRSAAARLAVWGTVPRTLCGRRAGGAPRRRGDADRSPVPHRGPTRRRLRQPRARRQPVGRERQAGRHGCPRCVTPTAAPC